MLFLTHPCALLLPCPGASPAQRYVLIQPVPAMQGSSLLMAEGVELDDLQGPFQPLPFYDSVQALQANPHWTTAAMSPVSGSARTPLQSSSPPPWW